MSAETANDAYKGHSLSLNERKTLKITGVTDAIGFDEESVTLESTAGRIEIGGEGLRFEVLNLKDGMVELTGRIDSILYAAEPAPEKNRNGFWAKLFR
ncbi:MAG: sporulation protein YabP [Clostridia bacterium]|nr:sporulation protein YabP [Clostridia bacterium]